MKKTALGLYIQANSGRIVNGPRAACVVDLIVLEPLGQHKAVKFNFWCVEVNYNAQFEPACSEYCHGFSGQGSDDNLWTSF